MLNSKGIEKMKRELFFMGALSALFFGSADVNGMLPGMGKRLRETRTNKQQEKKAELEQQREKLEARGQTSRELDRRIEKFGTRIKDNERILNREAKKTDTSESPRLQKDLGGTQHKKKVVGPSVATTKPNIKQDLRIPTKPPVIPNDVSGTFNRESLNQSGNNRPFDFEGSSSGYSSRASSRLSRNSENSNKSDVSQHDSGNLQDNLKKQLKNNQNSYSSAGSSRANSRLSYRSENLNESNMSQHDSVNLQNDPDNSHSSFIELVSEPSSIRNDSEYSQNQKSKQQRRDNPNDYDNDYNHVDDDEIEKSNNELIDQYSNSQNSTAPNFRFDSNPSADEKSGTEQQHRHEHSRNSNDNQNKDDHIFGARESLEYLSEIEKKEQFVSDNDDLDIMDNQLRSENNNKERKKQKNKKPTNQNQSLSNSQKSKAADIVLSEDYNNSNSFQVDQQNETDQETEQPSSDQFNDDNGYTTENNMESESGSQHSQTLLNNSQMNEIVDDEFSDDYRQ